MNPETEEKIYFYTEDLQVGYGGKQILNPVRIGIKKGEILTLVGPNGAGKSTILKSVAAQLPPLGGAVYLDGADLLGMKVVLEDGTEFGTLKDVMETGANDVYIINSREHGEVLLPAIKECILNVDLESGTMTIHLMKGLI